jgi:hypothetical protein
MPITHGTMQQKIADGYNYRIQRLDRFPLFATSLVSSQGLETLRILGEVKGFCRPYFIQRHVLELHGQHQ